MSFIANGNVLQTLLTGFQTAGAVAVNALDSILGAFEKLQGLVNSKADASAIQNLNGTANQVTVTQTDASNITLSLPQSIATTSLVSFAGVTVSGQGGLKAVGTNDGTEVAAGNVGELIAPVQSGTVALTSGTAADVTTQVFTKGRWLVFGEVTFIPNGQTISAMVVAASVVANTLPGNDYYINGDVRTATVPVSNPHVQVCRYLNVSVDTTVHLVAQVVAGGAGVTAQGALWGIRLP